MSLFFQCIQRSFDSMLGSVATGRIEMSKIQWVEIVGETEDIVSGNNDAMWREE